MALVYLPLLDQLLPWLIAVGTAVVAILLGAVLASSPARDVKRPRIPRQRLSA